MRIAFSTDEPARSAIARLGRTEDAQFAPGGRRLALAGYARHRILLLDVEARLDSRVAEVAVGAPLELESPALRAPHGIAWLGPDTLAVANRGGGVALFELPTGRARRPRLRLEPARVLGADRAELIRMPGSVAVVALGQDLAELLICNNSVHHVTRHLIDLRSGLASLASELLLDDGLDVPDGVDCSPSGEWIAVSNHDRHNVFVYRDGPELGPDSRPAAVLEGMRYPHGLRFAAGGAALVVADAGAPFVHIFASADGDWRGQLEPNASIPVLDDAAFARGSHDRAEGGPKGIAVTAEGLMAVTCQEQPLAFFDLREFLPATSAATVPTADGERARAAMLRYLAAARSGLAEATEAIRRTSEREVKTVVNSRSWRLTAPLRRLSARLRRRTRRRRDRSSLR